MPADDPVASTLAETATCPRCGHAIDGRSPHPPECARCPEGYCEGASDAPDAETSARGRPDPLPLGFIVPKRTPFRPEVPGA